MAGPETLTMQHRRQTRDDAGTTFGWRDDAGTLRVEKTSSLLPSVQLNHRAEQLSILSPAEFPPSRLSPPSWRVGPRIDHVSFITDFDRLLLDPARSSHSKMAPRPPPRLVQQAASV